MHNVINLIFCLYFLVSRRGRYA